MLSIFPGLDLLGRAFEAEGFTVLRGPDKLWGGDIRAFHAPPGVFQGVIGGPPCQVFSQAKNMKCAAKRHADLIPEFMRIVREAAPLWWLMEEIPQALTASANIPRGAWSVMLTDSEAGGLTKRRRAFLSWPWPIPAIFEKVGERAAASPSLLAQTYKRGRDKRADDKAMPYGYLTCSGLTVEKMAELQGWPELAEPLRELGANRQTASILLGNGVPRALGQYVAHEIRVWLCQQ